MKPKQKIYISLILTVISFFILKMVLPKNDCAKLLDDHFFYTKTYNEETYNIVICGDSRIYRGISPHYVQNEMPGPLTAFNIAYSSAGFSDDYLNFALSKLKKNSKDKYLVLGITPHSLTPGGIENEQMKTFQTKSKFEIIKKTKLLPLFCYFENYVPLDVALGLDYPNDYIYHKDGWVEYNPIVIDSTEANQSYLRIFNKNKVDSNIVRSFIKRLKEIDSTGIKIIAFRPPTTFQMKNIENENSGLDYQNLVLETENFIDWVDVDFKNYISYDGSHLTGESAIKLSKKIGKHIKKKLK